MSRRISRTSPSRSAATRSARYGADHLVFYIADAQSNAQQSPQESAAPKFQASHCHLLPAEAKPFSAVFAVDRSAVLGGRIPPAGPGTVSRLLQSFTCADQTFHPIP